MYAVCEYYQNPGEGVNVLLLPYLDPGEQREQIAQYWIMPLFSNNQKQEC